MEKQDYTVNITVSATAREAFNGINNIPGWWTENWQGNSQNPDDEFTTHFGETFMTMKVAEMIPDQKVVWLVTDSYKHWVQQNRTEWIGTKISFEIAEKGNKTEIRFSHIGLVPGLECYNGCINAWGGYIQQSLSGLLNTGKGKPPPLETSRSAAKK
jgi:hypothetical protein